MTLREDVRAYAKETYGTEPEYLWRSYPNYAVFRHEDNKKWYALMMDVPRSRLGLPGGDRVDILNVKLEDPLLRDLLLQGEGYLPPYHISRGGWISILLDGTVPFEEIRGLIDLSFSATASAKVKRDVRPPKEWLIPANPRYYDIEQDFAVSDTIDWKQSSRMRPGDTVYIYMAAPVSAILYKCEVLETDIPYKYEDENVTMRRVMKLRLTRRYDPDRFTLDLLRTEHGVYGVRGPRGVPRRLSQELNLP